MTRSEYISALEGLKIDSSKVSKLEKNYETSFSDVVKKIISNADETIFFDEAFRVLSFDEVEDAEKDLHVDFKNKGIIPLLDCGENDFIVYHFKDDIWSKFNIIDETVFKKKKSLAELLKE